MTTELRCPAGHQPDIWAYARAGEHAADAWRGIFGRSCGTRDYLQAIVCRVRWVDAPFNVEIYYDLWLMGIHHPFRCHSFPH